MVTTLLSFLNQILNNTMSGISYGDARYMLDDTDVDPSNASNVILIYLGTSVSGVWDGMVQLGIENMFGHNQN